MIKKEIITLIQQNMRFKTKLALELNVSVSTIERYLRTNDEQLTLLKSLEMIEEEFGINGEDILERN